ncbi:MAG TPA: hypothetical protein VF258_06760 [Luteolibacter sp.]
MSASRSSDTLPDPLVREAIARLCDGDLSDDGFEWLQARLEADPVARNYYFQQVALETALDALHATPLSPGRRAPLQVLRRAAPLLAAAAVVLLGLVLFFNHRKGTGGDLRFSQGAEWTISGRSDATAKQLSYGMSLALTQGVVELRLKNDVTAVIEAPAAVSLQDAKTLIFNHGSGVFHVGQAGHGFAVVTPTQRIVDLGTEFGVRLQPGQAETELQIFQGKVEVSPAVANGYPPLQQTVGAVILKGSSVLRSIDPGSSLFQRGLPAASRQLLREDFERGATEGDRTHKDLSGWQLSDFCGTFNPGSNLEWYDKPALDDTASTGGAVEGMNGPSLGFFYNASPAAAIRHPLGLLEADTSYRVSLLIGVRSNQHFTNDRFAGYSVQLVSDGVVLAGLERDDAPGPLNSFTRVGFTWDSTQLPAGAAIGRPLEIRIAPRRSSIQPIGLYLDFDSLDVTSITQDSPSSRR